MVQHINVVRIIKDVLHLTGGKQQQKNERLRQELDRAKAKADYYDAFIHPESCTNIRATAKELKVPEKMFTAFLIRKRYLYRAPSGSLMPYAKAADDGLFFGGLG